MAKGNQQIDDLIYFLKTRQHFDVVVCDSVLNSVDTKDAEQAILGCLNLFCKKGGKLFISGRPIEGFENKLSRKTDKNVGKRFIEFLDGDKFTGNFRGGNWYYQHFHSKKDVKKLLNQYGFKITKLHWMKFGDSWQVEAIKVKELEEKEYRKAVDFEFNLPLPGGSYKRNAEVKAALGIG